MPETLFAWNGDVALAYQVLGEGPIDLLYVPGFFSNVDVMWENPSYPLLRVTLGFPASPATRPACVERRLVHAVRGRK
jgi:hypothetical protein